MSCTKARSANGIQNGRRVHRLYRFAAQANRNRRRSNFEAYNRTDKTYRKKSSFSDIHCEKCVYFFCAISPFCDMSNI